MARAGGEHGRVAAVGGPLHVAAQVRDHGVGADPAQGLRLRVGADERAHAVPAMQQQRHDALPEAAVRARDEDDHAVTLTRGRPRPCSAGARARQLEDAPRGSVALQAPAVPATTVAVACRRAAITPPPTHTTRPSTTIEASPSGSSHSPTSFVASGSPVVRLSR